MRSTTLLLSALAIAPLAIPVAQADPPRTAALQCTAGGLAAPPKFTQLSPGRAEYSFSGACISRDGHSFAYRVDATWTPPEIGRGNANATEILHIDMTSGPSQSYTILLGGQCGADPWLYNVRCGRIGDTVPEEVRAWWYDVTRAPFPFSRLGIPNEQRAALRRQYDRANGVFDRSDRYSDRVTLEPIERIGTQTGATEMTEQAVPAAARPNGAESGIIIVSGNPPHQPAATAETGMVELQSVASQRATRLQATTGMLSGIDESAHNVAGNLREGAAPEPPICVNARGARARNSPAAPGLEQQCLAAGGRL
ncbi:MAG: hypothetical protein ABIO38_00720 [Luteimonas sp.]